MSLDRMLYLSFINKVAFMSFFCLLSFGKFFSYQVISAKQVFYDSLDICMSTLLFFLLHALHGSMEIAEKSFVLSRNEVKDLSKLSTTNSRVGTVF